MKYGGRVRFNSHTVHGLSDVKYCTRELVRDVFSKWMLYQIFSSIRANQREGILEYIDLGIVARRLMLSVNLTARNCSMISQRVATKAGRRDLNTGTFPTLTGWSMGTKLWVANPRQPATSGFEKRPHQLGAVSFYTISRLPFLKNLSGSG